MTSSAPTLPTEENHFKAYYTPWLGSLFLVLGLLNVFLALWLMLLTGKFSVAIVTGVAISAVGFLYLTRPCFAIAPNRLTLYNLIGSPIKRYPFASFSDIYIEGKKVYIRDQNSLETSTTGSVATTEKVKLTKWMVKPADWKTLQSIASS